jgi:hypothetical protein
MSLDTGIVLEEWKRKINRIIHLKSDILKPLNPQTKTEKEIKILFGHGICLKRKSEYLISDNILYLQSEK